MRGSTIYLKHKITYISFISRHSNKTKYPKSRCNNYLKSSGSKIHKYNTQEPHKSEQVFKIIGSLKAHKVKEKYLFSNNNNQQYLRKKTIQMEAR